MKGSVNLGVPNDANPKPPGPQNHLNEPVVEKELGM